MKTPKHFVLALLGAICLGVLIGVTVTQDHVGAAQQPARPTPVTGPQDQLPGQFNPRKTQPRQTPKPELEVKPGDSEEIKVLKTELKELRERVAKLEENTSWRIRPAAGR